MNVMFWFKQKHMIPGSLLLTFDLDQFSVVLLLFWLMFLGFVDHFSYLFLEVSTSCLGTEENSGNIKAVTTMLLLLLETLHGILKYVSEIVRRALEVNSFLLEIYTQLPVSNGCKRLVRDQPLYSF